MERLSLRDLTDDAVRSQLLRRGRLLQATCGDGTLDELEHVELIAAFVEATYAARAEAMERRTQVRLGIIPHPYEDFRAGGEIRLSPRPFI